ncbi:MAG: hypothetical protein DLM69_05675, partial [Candidatus Chloroheliales bacterium]
MQGRGGALAVGSRLQGGKYVVEAVLGEGSFGITYRAANTGSRLHQQVAIKELFIEGSTRAEAGRVLHPPERSDESWGRLTSNFEREAQTIARLKHPGIVTVYDCFEENDTLYIVMEFVDGTNLDRLVRQRGGHLPEAEALGYVAEIAAALTVLHANGVLHRDIKPANIMIDKSGHAVLIDFGTARDFVLDKTLTHSVILTPAFAPPEQFQPRAHRGPFTDIYALAATTYWLLTSDLLDMWNTGKVKEDERLSPRIRAALTHALAFNSTDRTPDAASFSRELLGPATPQPASPPPARPVSPTATTLPNAPQPAATPGAAVERPHQRNLGGDATIVESSEQRGYTLPPMYPLPTDEYIIDQQRWWGALPIIAGILAAGVLLVALYNLMLSGRGSAGSGALATPVIVANAAITNTIPVATSITTVTSTSVPTISYPGGVPPTAAPPLTSTNTTPGPIAINVDKGIADKTMTIITNRGTVVLGLFSNAAPNTVKNYEERANRGEYNGRTWHRVEEWVLQGNDPAGIGSGGGNIPTEINKVPFGIGSLGVARTNDITYSNDSQLFIVKTIDPVKYQNFTFLNGVFDPKTGAP